MEYDIHTVLDGLTLAATCWVIYELWGPLKGTYQAEQDNLQAYYVVSNPLPANLRSLGSCKGAFCMRRGAGQKGGRE